MYDKDRVEGFQHIINLSRCLKSLVLCVTIHIKQAPQASFGTGAFSLKPVEDCANILHSCFFLVCQFLKEIIYIFVVLSHP